MAIKRLDHVNFITNDMESTINFYINIIGLIPGPNSKSAASGMVYLYLPTEDIAILHIGDANIKRDSSRFKQRAILTTGEFTTGIIDHFCLQCDISDFDNMLEKLNKNNITFDFYIHPDESLKQIWMLDPNNIRVELNFSA